MSDNYFRQAEAAERAALTMPDPADFGAELKAPGMWIFDDVEAGDRYLRAYTEWRRAIDIARGAGEAERDGA